MRSWARLGTGDDSRTYDESAASQVVERGAEREAELGRDELAAALLGEPGLEQPLAFDVTSDARPSCDRSAP